MNELPRPERPALRTSRLLRVLVVGGAMLGGVTLAAGCAGKKNADASSTKPDRADKPADSGGGVQGW